jgi:hypothetical protein
LAIGQPLDFGSATLPELRKAMPSDPFNLEATVEQMHPTPNPAAAEPVHPLEKAHDLVREVMTAYIARDNYQTSTLILAALSYLNELPVLGVSDQERQTLGQTLDSILDIFCQPDFIVPEEHGFLYLVYNSMIGNIMEGCLNTTTDHHLIKVNLQQQNAFKTLVLYSARNNESIDISNLLVANPELVSRWFFQTWKTVFSGNCSQRVTANLARFLSQMDHRIIPAMDMQELYFGCTYLGIPEERRAKELINQTIQRNIPVSIANRSDPKRIAVFSEFWSKGHSVHRTLNGYIAALKPYFHVTLLHSLRESSELDTSLFDDVVRIQFENSSLNLAPLEKNNFAAVIFPDVGMTLQSILLVNFRIAPVQVIMTGHPVSTFGAKTDYFISGRDVDVPMIAKQNYSERLVLLPGYGAVHELPTYPIRGNKKKTTEVLINASWYGQKIHWHCLDTVNEAMRRCKNRVKLRLFAGSAPIQHKGYPAFFKEVSRRMTNGWVEIVPHLPYPDYMGLMEEADFAADVFPFAGSNTVADNLYLRKPTLAREGYRWFNRIGPAMLRSVDLGELIATSDQEYIEKFVRLVDDEAYRNELTESLQGADLEHKVFHPQGANEFAQFIQNVAKNPKHYPGDDPILL